MQRRELLRLHQGKPEMPGLASDLGQFASRDIKLTGGGRTVDAEAGMVEALIAELIPLPPVEIAVFVRDKDELIGAGEIRVDPPGGVVGIDQVAVAVGHDAQQVALGLA